ncbi:hypothetical protein ACI784_06850 [Geodermatophilus sp. SYSU D01186]
MSVVVVRLWWACATPEEERRLRQLLRPGSWFPDGCHSRRLTREGCGLRLVEIWADRAAAGRALEQLPERLRCAGVGGPESTVVSLPADGWSEH